MFKRPSYVVLKTIHIKTDSRNRILLRWYYLYRLFCLVDNNVVRRDKHEMVDGQKCKLICGKEFCDTGFGEVCEESETHCINTKCKWDPIIYAPQLVDNKHEACSVAGSDGVASLYRNPNYVEEI